MPEITGPRSADYPNVLDLRSKSAYRPDMAALARQQVANARQTLGLTRPEFAEVLAPVLGWTPTGSHVEAWETSVVPPGDVLLALGFIAQAAPGTAEHANTDVIAQLTGTRYAGTEAIYPTRSEFSSRVPPHALFDGAREIRASGLSLNLICQQYADQSLHRIIQEGGKVHCLFLAPGGAAIKAREKEEGYEGGYLSALTDVNIQILKQRLRGRLPQELQHNIVIATYDETIRFNITLIDSTVAVVQPYLHAARGVESPTLVLRRHDNYPGLFETFNHTFEWLWERRTEL